MWKIDKQKLLHPFFSWGAIEAEMEIFDFKKPSEALFFNANFLIMKLDELKKNSRIEKLRTGRVFLL